MADPTTPKRNRPALNRSRTADASISPPTRPITADNSTNNTSQPKAPGHAHSGSRKLHLGGFLHHAHLHDRLKHKDSDDFKAKEKEKQGFGSGSNAKGDRDNGSKTRLIPTAGWSRPVSAVLPDLNRITSRLPGETRSSINLSSGAHSAGPMSTLGADFGNVPLTEPALALGVMGGVSIGPAAVSTYGPAKLPFRIPAGSMRPEVIQQERERGIERDKELRSSLDTLSELAHDGMRTLDYAYYNILEKVANLRTTVGLLQDLCSASTQLHEKFQDDAKEVKENIQGQIEAFSNFGDQRSKIEELEGRVRAGRSKAKELTERLESARQQVEDLEQRETEWQMRTSKRIRLGWFCLAMLILMLGTLIILKRRWYLRQKQLYGARGTTEKEAGNQTLPDFIMSDMLELSKTALAQVNIAASSTSRNSPSLTAEARLARLDEL